MQLDSGRLWYVPQLPQVELLIGRYQRQVFPWHAHEGYCLSLQEQGSEVLSLPTGPLPVHPGQLLVLAPGQVHTNYAYQPGQPWQYRSFYLAPAFLRNLAPAGSGGPIFSQLLLDDPALFARLRQVHQKLEVQGYSARTLLDLEQVLVDLLRRHSHPSPVLPPVAEPKLANLPQLLGQLSQRLASRLTVAELAAEAGLSRFQFTRAFALATGLSPLAYLTQQRLRQAKRLLQQGAPPVVAALETGFFDQSHFARHFKRVVGVTPGQYRALACTNVQDRAG